MPQQVRKHIYYSYFLFNINYDRHWRGWRRKTFTARSHWKIWHISKIDRVELFKKNDRSVIRTKKYFLVLKTSIPMECGNVDMFSTRSLQKDVNFSLKYDDFKESVCILYSKKPCYWRVKSQNIYWELLEFVKLLVTEHKVELQTFHLTLLGAYIKKHHPQTFLCCIKTTKFEKRNAKLQNATLVN